MHYLTKAKGPVEEIPVNNPGEVDIKEENGIKGRAMLLQQIKAVNNAIEKHQPNAIVILGGDCLVDLAPFAYLNSLYNGELGILWIDAHPDVMSPKNGTNAHAMVLGNLLGEGDEAFSNVVKHPVKPERVLIAGLGKTLPFETEFLEKHKIATVSPKIVNHSSKKVINWINNTA